MAVIDKNNFKDLLVKKETYDNDLYVGIEFFPKYISENIIELKPVNFILGNYSSDLDEFVDENGISYRDISDIAAYNEATRKNFFGFPVEYNKLKLNYDMRKYDYSKEECFNEYLVDISRYIYQCDIDEFDPQKNSDIYMINPDNNKSYSIDISKNFFFAFQTKQEKNPIVVEDEEVKIFDPKEAYEFITKRVMGQDEQVRDLVNAVFLNQKYGKYEGIKTNLLLIGSSGSGKTEMIRSLSKYANIPLVVEDATKYTSSGYVGASVIDMLNDLYKRSGKTLSLAERGIIVLDEADKMCDNGDNKNHVRKGDVQEELLTLLEGSSFHLDEYDVDINTSNITFILCGAFSKLTHKDNNKKTVGFVKEEEKAKSKKITTEDLCSFGMMVDLLRRLPIRIVTNDLTKDDLKEILIKSEISNLKIYENVLKIEDNVTLVYDDATLDAIVDKALTFKGGASGLHSAVTTTLLSAIQSIGDLDKEEAKLIISEDTVNDPSKFLIKRREKVSKNGKSKLSQNSE